MSLLCAGISVVIGKTQFSLVIDPCGDSVDVRRETSELLCGISFLPIWPPDTQT
jgi:hypothetical protein